jgi:hypothetical protein
MPVLRQLHHRKLEGGFKTVVISEDRTIKKTYSILKI